MANDIEMAHANFLGKLYEFTNLNCSAIKGDDFPIDKKTTTSFPVRQNSEVVIIYLKFSHSKLLRIPQVTCHASHIAMAHGELTPQVIADQCHQRSAKEHLRQGSLYGKFWRYQKWRYPPVN